MNRSLRSDFFSLSPREARTGREPESGEIDKKRLLSPALSSFFEEERESKRCRALKANLPPNTTGQRAALQACETSSAWFMKAAITISPA